MLIGDPYKLSIFIEVIQGWNLDKTSFRNGILLFCVDGQLFPKEVVTATLNSEVPPLEEALKNVSVNKTLYNMGKREAFREMYKITFLNDENNYQYYLSSTSLSDMDCYIFSVSNGKQIRILASKLNYIVEKGIHDLSEMIISEAFITYEELNNMITKLNSVLN